MIVKLEGQAFSHDAKQAQGALHLETEGTAAAANLGVVLRIKADQSVSTTHD